MKKMLILAVIVSLATGSLFANEAVLIDFGLLTADMTIGEGDTPNQNRATLVDFGNVRFAGSFTEQQRALMRTSLGVENWDVDLAPSSRTVIARSRSFVRQADSRRFGPVLGVRVHFPTENFHSWALVRPPFEIPAFAPAVDVADDGTITPAANGGPSQFEGGLGVVHNVATVRAVAVNVFGMNFPHSLSVVLYDGAGNRRVLPMGNLNFDGWAELR